MKRLVLALFLLTAASTLAPSAGQPSTCINSRHVAERLTADNWEVLRYTGQPATNLINWYNIQEPPTNFIGDEVLFGRHDDQPYLFGIFEAGCLVHMDAIPRNAIRWPTRNT